MLRLLLKVCLTKSINFVTKFDKQSSASTPILSSASTPILSFLLAHDLFLVLSLLEINLAYSVFQDKDASEEISYLHEQECCYYLQTFLLEQYY